jgi:basic amino acid/polyamine antiporter, APA family
VIVGVLLLLVGFSIGGFFEIEAERHDPFLPEGFGGVLAAVGLIIVSFTGFEKISTVVEEIRKPGHNLPRAIIGSVIIYVFTGIIPYEQVENAETALVDAGDDVFGNIGRIAMSIGGLLATASSANAAILASSRINFAMGRDRMLPIWFSEIHSEHLTPHRAIIVTGGGAILLALSGQAPRLAEISSALFMISYALLAAGMIVMRQVNVDWYQPDFRVPFYPWLSAAGGIAALAVIFTMDRFSQLAGLGLAALSLLWYYLWARQRTQVTGEVGHWLKEVGPLEQIKSAVGLQEEPLQTLQEEILVVIGDDTRGGLILLASALAEACKNRDLLLARMIPVPQGLSLVDAERLFLQRKPHLSHEIEQKVEESKQSKIYSGSW